MRSLFKRLWKDELGISATEYGILAAVFAAGLITVMVAFRTQISQLFTNATGEIAGIETGGTE